MDSRCAATPLRKNDRYDTASLGKTKNTFSAHGFVQWYNAHRDTYAMQGEVKAMAGRKGVAGPLTKVEGRGVLRRTRLNALLDQALSRPFTTIVAGPGYGKSVAVYSYLRESGARAIWVQLSEEDSTPSYFWETFSRAFKPLNQELAATMLALGFPESEEMEAYLAEVLRSDFKPRFRYVIVFDDLHLLKSGPVIDFITLLATSLTEGASAVAISRRDNIPQTSRLAQTDTLSRIDESELAFTKSEMLEYFELIGVTPSNEVAANIYYETEGLPFAISFAGQLLERNPEDSAYLHTALKGNFNRIIDEQLFSIISDELKRFLLKLSLIKHLAPELIDELEEGQDFMDELVAVSSLIRYDNYMHVYRLHHLLLQYLENKQDMLTEAERVQVYEKAARWCDANGYRIDALSYYRAMGNYDAIVNIAFGYPLVMPSDIAVELLEALESAPREFFDTSPAACVLYPRLIMTMGRVEESVKLIHEFIGLAKADPPSANRSRVLMGLYNTLGFARMISCPETHNFRFYEYFEEALNYAESATRTSVGGHLIYNVGPYALRLGRGQAGDPEAFIEAVRRATPCTTATMRGCMHGLDSLVCAEYAYFRGLTVEAEGHALRCIRDAREYGQSEIECRALYLLLRSYLHAGKYEQITNVFVQLDALMDDKNFLNRHLIHEVISSWFFAMIGEVNRVESWLKGNLWSSGLNDLVSGMDDFAKIRYYFAIKDYEVLISFLENRLSRFIIGKIGLMSSKAVCLFRLGKREEAFACLKETYDLAHPCGFDMLFVELGNNMRSLATAALKVPSSTLGIPTAWLEAIRSRATTYAKRVAFVRSCYLEKYNPDASVQLSARELEVLEDLTHGLSRTEISMARGISLGTVKSMLPIIYAKLGADSAMDAVRIATTKQLL
jgi:LuxR family maltose regulon positive regulatory protein